MQLEVSMPDFLYVQCLLGVNVPAFFLEQES